MARCQPFFHRYIVVANFDLLYFFFFQAEDGIRDGHVTGVQTCALPIWLSMQLTENVQMAQTLPAKWVAHLMAKMQAMYGAKFTQQWQGIDPAILQSEWAEQLAGFSGDELSRGLQACRERPWPPTLPEFMVLCRPPIQPEAAFYEAVTGLGQRRRGERGEWTHPAI